MPIYADLDGGTGVVSYELGDDWIEVEFERGVNRKYLFTYRSAGADNVEIMKQLAARGEGLNAYISKYAARSYASKR